MTYEKTKELLDQYSIEDLQYLQKMIGESISAKSTHNYYKKMVKDFSINNKVGDCFLYKDPNSNTLSLQFVTNIYESVVKIIRYDIYFDNNDICWYECDLKLFEVNKYKKSNIKESDIRKICDDINSSVKNIYKVALSDILHLIEKSDDI